ncbi:hypothetical protein BDZ89DRAFT_429660 [Hymenopellis radicata]|nr:hypothetical protein BDZ89DRAFT_429660 [Hymenopellis radicata]
MMHRRCVTILSLPFPTIPISFAGSDINLTTYLVYSSSSAPTSSIPRCLRHLSQYLTTYDPIASRNNNQEGASRYTAQSSPRKVSRRCQRRKAPEDTSVSVCLGNVQGHAVQKSSPIRAPHAALSLPIPLSTSAKMQHLTQRSYGFQQPAPVQPIPPS